VPTELQWYRLYDLINGLPKIDWYIYQIEMSGDYLFVRAKSSELGTRTMLFIINPEGEFI